jgi:hypothetical protein
VVETAVARIAPGAEIAALEAEIALRRERVAASLGELQRRIRRVTSWRRWAEAHPVAWIGAGLCLGLLVGQLGGRRRADE